MNREIKFRAWDQLINKFIDIYLIGRLDFNDKTYIFQQFTGLKDKNGKEIYEGDIFKGRQYKWDSVKFENGKFQVNLIGGRLFDLCELFEDGNKPEVIGNIFENPELLKCS